MTNTCSNCGESPCQCVLNSIESILREINEKMDKIVNHLEQRFEKLEGKYKPCAHCDDSVTKCAYCGKGGVIYCQNKV